MRISDWSSDVCSSDLGNGIKAATQHPGAFGCILQAFPAGEAGRKHHAPDAICPERINGNGSGKSAVDAARQTQDDSGKAIAVHIIAEAKHHRAIDIFWVRIGYGAFARRADPAAMHVPAPMRLHYRSEEHTSELQSLMRISYAVFCL